MNSRTLGAVLLMAITAFAGPPLTTIQDVLYKADGTPFNGTLTVTWSSFEAPDTSDIPMQTTTVAITNGSLRIQLVPTTTSNPATYYTVKYNSDGRVQFQETWAVPPSTQPLRVRDVRIAAPGNTSGGAGAVTTVQETDVVGLTADLGARPTKGASYANGRVAMVNQQGAIDAVSGAASDCVRVDGSTGPCGPPVVSFIDSDVPGGIVDGANTSFSLTDVPTPASSLAIYRNGLLQKEGQDYSVSGNTLEFIAGAPQPGDTLLATYRMTGTGADASQLFPNPQVLCSGVGASTVNTTSTSLATCTIPAHTLLPGDRVEILFDAAHQGAGSGFAFEMHWGGTTVLSRSGGTGDAVLSGRADAGIDLTGAQISSQAWGTVLPFSAAIVSAGDVYSNGLTVDFRGNLTQAGDSLTLRNFAVIRVP